MGPYRADYAAWMNARQTMTEEEIAEEAAEMEFERKQEDYWSEEYLEEQSYFLRKRL